MGECSREFHASSKRIRRWLLNRDAVVPMPLPRQVSQPPRYVRGLGDVHELRSPSAKRKAARK
jgi:hypothetical protein